MAVLVQKFGGTSVGSLERIQRVAERIKHTRSQGHEVVVVVSAMSGETNRLTDMGRQIAAKGAAEYMDVLLASGEQVTISLLSLALAEIGLTALPLLAHQVAIRTDEQFGRARITKIDTERLQQALSAQMVPVIAGFQGISANGQLTTLGRGGSDTTAVAVSAALQADECHICTDVDGVYTADPRVVPQARRLRTVTFEEMLELASLGSKVLHPRSVEFAGKYQVPLRVCSTFDDGPGTLITMENPDMEQPIVSGIAHTSDEAKVTMLGVPDIPGVASKILGPVSAAQIEVDMIVQNTGADGLTDFTFTVKREDFDRTMELLNGVQERLGARELSGDNTIAKLSVVGVGMRSHAGVATRMFDALAADNINIQMISTSEIKISVVVDERYLELAVRSVHGEFGLSDPPASA
ncbi:MAG: aspartate kinase [Pseudomonadales bacterium]